MRKQIFFLAAAGILTLPLISNAQPFWGLASNSTLTGIPTNTFDVVTAMDGNGPYTMRMGSAFPMYGAGALSFNLTRVAYNTWNYGNDVVNNGGAVMFAKTNGSLNFSFHQSSGPTSGSLTDQQMRDNVKLQIEPTGNINMFRPYDPDARQIRAFSQDHGLQLMSNSSSSDGSGIEMYSLNSAGMGRISFIAKANSDPQNVAYDFLTHDNANANGWASKMKIYKSGNLWLDGDIDFNPGAVPTKDWQIHGNLNKGRMLMYGGNSASSGAGIEFVGLNNSTFEKGAIYFISNSTTSQGPGYKFTNYDGTNWNDLMNIHKNGKVVIGAAPINSTGFDYKLYVKNGILTERIKVALSNDPSNWSDFVFDEDYKLMPLSEVEAYIEENNHLPEIPSTKEVLSEGLDLAKMDAKLLQKVEELTLYVIEQQKEIKIQQQKIAELSKKLK